MERSGYSYCSDMMYCEPAWMSAPIQTHRFTQTAGQLALLLIAAAHMEPRPKKNVSS